MLPRPFLVLSPVDWLAFSFPGYQVLPRAQGAGQAAGRVAGGEGVTQAWGLDSTRPPKHQHVVQPSIAPKAATAQTPLGGQGCHGTQDRVIGPSEAQIWGGVPQAATVARVPAYTSMHTVIHTCTFVPSPTLTPSFAQENLLPGPHTCRYHAGLPPTNS